MWRPRPVADPGPFTPRWRPGLAFAIALAHLAVVDRLPWVPASTEPSLAPLRASSGSQRGRVLVWLAAVPSPVNPVRPDVEARAAGDRPTRTQPAPAAASAPTGRRTGPMAHTLALQPAASATHFEGQRPTSAPAAVPPHSSIDPGGPIETPALPPADFAVADERPSPATATAGRPAPGEAGGEGEGDDLAAAPPPVYPVHWPPPSRFRLRLDYLGRPLAGALSWQPAGGRYTLTLSAGPGGDGHDATAAGDGEPPPAVYAWTSVGHLSLDGLVPGRLLDRRPRRAAVAANFEAGSGWGLPVGRVRLSSGRGEWPMWPGTQDRLSWIVQLAGIAEAAARTGAWLPEVRLHVVDARGASMRWRLVDRGWTTLDSAAGPLRVRHFQHRAASPEALQIDAWLDPQRGHWPLQIRYTLPRGGATIGWTLL